jgi:hypothetical protein
MAAWTKVNVTGVGKWCDPDHRLNANVSEEELAERKALAKLTTPGDVYIRLHKELILSNMVDDGVDPKHCKGQPMYMLKYFKEHVEPNMDESARKHLEKTVMKNRSKIHDTIRKWKGLSKSKSSGGGAGRPCKAAADGWLRAPSRVVDGKQIITFYYNPETKTLAQMRVVAYTDVDANGIPIPPDGMMVKGKRGQRKAGSPQPKSSSEEPEAEEEDDGDEPEDDEEGDDPEPEAEEDAGPEPEAEEEEDDGDDELLE